MNREEYKSGFVTFVLFGATGNLAQLKIMPALCALFVSFKLPKDIRIIAYGRRSWTDEQYREFIKSSLKNFDQKRVEDFLGIIDYVEGVFDDASSFEKLKSKINSDNVIYHLAVLPESYTEIIESLGKAKMKGKILIEKPFGHDLLSAWRLENLIEKYFTPEDIFRIDHYLGKGGLRDLYKKRIDDPEFETALSRKYVSSIQVRMREVLDINGRGSFYDKVGAFKDVGQNHLMVMVATLLMDLLKAKNDQSLARAKAIDELVITKNNQKFIRGQYEGYKEEKDVDPNSTTETYFKIMAESNDPRWQGVPIVFEAGKAVEAKERKEDIIITYKDGRVIVVDIDHPKNHNSYEIILESAILNDKSLFVGLSELIASWKFGDSALDVLKDVLLSTYLKGSEPQINN